MKIGRFEKGFQFTSIHFPGVVTVISKHPESNSLKVSINRNESEWEEDWDLQVTTWAFETGEYSKFRKPELSHHEE